MGCFPSDTSLTLMSLGILPNLQTTRKVGPLHLRSPIYRSQLWIKTFESISCIYTKHIQTVFLPLFPKQYSVTMVSIVCSIVSNPDIISTIQDDVYMLNANALPFHVNDLSIWGSGGYWNQFPVKTAQLNSSMPLFSDYRSENKKFCR